MFAKLTMCRASEAKSYRYTLCWKKVKMLHCFGIRNKKENMGFESKCEED
jgi:hypothetical protein